MAFITVTSVSSGPVVINTDVILCVCAPEERADPDTPEKEARPLCDYEAEAWIHLADKSYYAVEEGVEAVYEKLVIATGQMPPEAAPAH